MVRLLLCWMAQRNINTPPDQLHEVALGHEHSCWSAVDNYNTYMLQLPLVSMENAR